MRVAWDEIAVTTLGVVIVLFILYFTDWDEFFNRFNEVLVYSMR